ncbi:MAG: hypothetical protein E4H44_05095 [Candidatus Aminicenantes bacterium]|nr:MAG: hypothetical protein E4H44_05095 [Candidatus Aminicenantes bacterium]
MSQPAPKFEYGVFKRYKATHEFHVGALESNLFDGEIIETDGSTLRRGGQQFSVPSIVAAIKVGWLVLEGEEGTPYRPMPAGVEIHAADPKGQSRGPAKKMVLVADEQRSVGTLDQVRAKSGAKAPPTHVAGKAGEEYRAGVGAHVTDGFNSELITETAAGQEGRVISKFRTSAKAAPVDLSKGEDRQVRNKIAAQSGLNIEKARATGDVQEARSGDDLDELLPDAASSGRPAGGTAGEGGKETADERAERLTVAAAKAAAARAERMGQAKAAEAVVKGEDADHLAVGAGPHHDGRVGRAGRRHRLAEALGHREDGHEDGDHAGNPYD